MDNRPHKALANRTRWLKTKIDEFLAGTGLTKAMVGLSNVDNTSDLNKPISAEVKMALNDKEPTISVLPIEKGGTGRTDGCLPGHSSNELSLGYNLTNTPYIYINWRGHESVPLDFYSFFRGVSSIDYAEVRAKTVSLTDKSNAVATTEWVNNRTIQVLTSTGGYRVEPEDSSGKRLITQWGKVTTNTANYAVTFPIAFTTVPSVKINFEQPTYGSGFAPFYFATNSRTTTGFRITENGSAMLGGAILWEAKGY